jgi:hypothetical protein
MTNQGRTLIEYLELRRRYEPEIVTLVIVAESPPASGKYFYDPAGARSEWLFAALMKQLRVSPLTKEEGLRTFQGSGWFLIDATYKPVDKLSKSDADRMIERDYPSLRDDLSILIPDRSVPIVLIKTSVCRILKPMLVRDGFNVINGERVVYFPACGRQIDFHRQFGAILESAGIRLPAILP